MIHVVILAQGEQRRIPDLRIPKQLLPLPLCGNTPILNRTIRQIMDIVPEATPPAIEVVGWPHFVDHFTLHPIYTTTQKTWLNALHCRPTITTLPDPGNSSLKGFSRYRDQHANFPFASRTVVLLGDVVYSWQILRELLDGNNETVWAVSDDISPSAGELWGIAWNERANDDMMESLDRAMAKHPTQTVYQPGQMRLWLWEFEAMLDHHRCRVVTPRDEGDYTVDIDLPRHAKPEFLFELSRWASDDDAKNGLSW